MTNYTSFTDILTHELDHLKFGVNNVFADKQPWQIVLTCLLTSLVGFWVVTKTSSLSYKSLKKSFFKHLKRVPILKQKVEGELKKCRKQIDAAVHEDDIKFNDGKFHQALPEKGLSEADVLKEASAFAAVGDYDVHQGKVSGASYGGDHIIDTVTEVYKKFAFTTALHPDVFPACRRIEAEVVRMICNMFHGGPDSCGTMTSGGSESIFLATLAYRTRAYEKGIKHPEMLAPVTCHAAFDKACHMFNVKMRHIPVDKKTFKVDVKAMKRTISSNTCMLVGSAPNFPQGIIDPIDQIAKLGEKYDIPVHVDLCLGGFILAFMEEAGYPLSHHFDYKLPGVTSISCDTHKYGYTPKGSSVITYKSEEYRRFQFFCQPDWPGGIYASPTIQGSRSGASMATTWATMLAIGRDGYVNTTRKIIENARYICSRIEKMDGLELMGQPEASVVGFTSKIFNIYSLGDEMTKRGWNLNSIQFPSGIHIAVTAHSIQDGVMKQFCDDLEEITKELVKNPSDPVEGKSAIYGMAQSIPDRSLVSELAFSFLDSCYSTSTTLAA